MRIPKSAAVAAAGSQPVDLIQFLREAASRAGDGFVSSVGDDFACGHAQVSSAVACIPASRDLIALESVCLSTRVCLDTAILSH